MRGQLLITVAASSSRSGLIPESDQHPPGGWTRRPHPAGGRFPVSRGTAGSGHGTLSCCAPDRKRRPLPKPARVLTAWQGREHISPPGRGRVIHGFGGQVPVHVASDDRGSSSSSQQPRSAGTDCQTGAASAFGPAVFCQCGGSGLRPPSAPVGALRPLSRSSASQADRPCACSSPARVSFAFGGPPPVGCRPPPGLHVGNDTAPSGSRETGLASSSPEVMFI